MFENSWKVSNPGIKYKKNPIYELQKVKIIKKEDIPEGLREDRYSELVEPEFGGKLIIVYQKDNIGRSAGNAQWCYVYDCENGNLTYKGTAIHKCVDPDTPDQNYNEKLFSILGDLVLKENNIRLPEIDLIEDNDWSDDKPAVLSYNIMQQNLDLEEMIILKTVAFNKRERQDIRNNRIALSTILEAVKIQVMKKVGYVKQNAREKIADAIMSAEIDRQLNGKVKITEAQEELLKVIKTQLDTIDSNTTSESLLDSISETLGRDVSIEEIEKLEINGASVLEILKDIKQISIKKEYNYEELEKNIVQTVTIDILTNNIDRHLTNWALIRDKQTDFYTLGLFDHATAFYNMSLRNNQLSIDDMELKKNWAPCSTLASKADESKVFSTGIDAFKFLMENYKEYVLEILNRLDYKLPQFENAIGYESIPNSEYDKLSQEEKAKYYRGELDMTVVPKKIIDGIKSKFRRIEKDYSIDIGENTREDN